MPDPVTAGSPVKLPVRIPCISYELSDCVYNYCIQNPARMYPSGTLFEEGTPMKYKEIDLINVPQ
jgi:hypothetical protein